MSQMVSSDSKNHFRMDEKRSILKGKSNHQRNIVWEINDTFGLIHSRKIDKYERMKIAFGYERLNDTFRIGV